MDRTQVSAIQSFHATSTPFLLPHLSSQDDGGKSGELPLPNLSHRLRIIPVELREAEEE